MNRFALYLGLFLAISAPTAAQDSTVSNSPQTEYAAELEPPPTPSAVDIKRARQGRWFLVTGVPLMFWGVIGAAMSGPNSCTDIDDDTNVMFSVNIAATGIGAALTTAGIVQLVRASKAARNHPDAKKGRGARAGVGLLSALVVGGGLFGGTMGTWAGCVSS